MNDSELIHAYNAYKLRYAVSRRGVPMTYAEFCNAHERWQKEYKAAWQAWDCSKIGNPPVVDELEYLLVV